MIVDLQILIKPLGRTYLAIYIIAKPYSLKWSFTYTHWYTLMHMCMQAHVYMYTCIYTYIEKISISKGASGYNITSLIQMTNINSTLMDSSSGKHTKIRYRSLNYFHESASSQQNLHSLNTNLYSLNTNYEIYLN